jgi:hypothetical protein
MCRPTVVGDLHMHPPPTMQGRRDTTLLGNPHGSSDSHCYVHGDNRGMPHRISPANLILNPYLLFLLALQVSINLTGDGDTDKHTLFLYIKNTLQNLKLHAHVFVHQHLIKMSDVTKLHKKLNKDKCLSG